jgi:hypothetical protein
MSKVFGIHTIELRPGVKAEDFERFVIEHFYSLSVEGGEIYVAIGDKGKRVGEYVLVWVFDSVEARDRFAGAPGSLAPEFSEEDKQKLAKYRTFCTWSFTDYVVLGK